MKYLLLSLLLVGCGKDVVAPAPCKVQEGPYGVQISCPDGSKAVVRDGLPGTNGSSTLVTPVKLCPGVTVYPSTFVEVAFCINNNLYASYSANGGFLTLIPPGTYGSNGINASCNFQVLPNCQVVN